MESLTIKIPDGFKVANFDTTTGEVTFEPKPKNIRERLQTMADVFAENKTTEAKFTATCEGLTPDEIGYRIEKLIAAAYNEGRQADFNDGTWKYYPIFDHSGGGFRFFDSVNWYSYSAVGARLLFVGPDAKANLLDAVEKFLPQYQYRTL